MYVFDFDNTLFKYNKHYVISFTKTMINNLNLTDTYLIDSILRFANTIKIGQYASNPNRPLDVHVAPEFYVQQDDYDGNTATKSNHLNDDPSRWHHCSSIFNIPQYAIFIGFESYIAHTNATVAEKKKIERKEYNSLDFFKKILKIFLNVLDEMFTLVCENPHEYGHVDKILDLNKYIIITASKYENVAKICQKLGLDAEIISSYGDANKFSPRVLDEFNKTTEINDCTYTQDENMVYFGDNYITDLHTLPKNWRGVFVGDSSSYILGRANRIKQNYMDLNTIPSEDFFRLLLL